MSGVMIVEKNDPQLMLLNRLVNNVQILHHIKYASNIVYFSPGASTMQSHNHETVFKIIKRLKIRRSQ